MSDIAKLHQIQETIGPGISVMAVSKTKSVDDIRPFLVAGHRLFGENRVTEATEKWLTLKSEYPNIRLHLIGHLQKNKIKEALNIFDSIDTIDSMELATLIAKQDIKNKTFMAEVNTGSEPQKTGFLPNEIDDFLFNSPLPITGLMCIPPIDEEPSPHFAFLKAIARRHNIKTLSMGMSADYEIAIEQGATIIRLGTILFGQRE